MRIAWTIASLLLVLAACEAEHPTAAPSPSATEVPPEPTPEVETGWDVVFVLPPRGSVPEPTLARYRDQLEALPPQDPDLVTDLRLVVPDGAAFQRDVIAVTAEDGAALVCAIGPGAARAVLEVAPDFPRTRFCAVPANYTQPPPGNVLGIDVRVEEVAYVAGAAAAIPAGAPPAAVYGQGTYGSERIAAAFVAGVASTDRDEEPVEDGEPTAPQAVPVSSRDGAYEFATDLYESGVFTVYTTAGSADPGVLQAAREQGALVVGDETTLVSEDEPPSESILFVVRLRLDVVMDELIDRAIPDWTGGTTSVGFAEGAFELGPGGSAIWQRIRVRVEGIADLVAAGAVSVLPG